MEQGNDISIEIPGKIIVGDNSDLFGDVLNNAKSVVKSPASTEEILNDQRSDEWFEKRKGKWTGSMIKELMKKGRGSEWGETAKHYLFSRFMERFRGTPDTPIPQTMDMKRGQELEPYAIGAFEKYYPDYIVEKAGFMEFPKCSTTGASPDGLVKDKHTGEAVGVFETKARRDTNTYSHAFDRVNEDHPEFWQLMSEMEAAGVDTAYYCHYTDLHEPPFDLQVQVVKISNDHILKLYERIDAAEEVLRGAWAIAGNIEGLEPHEITERIIEARNFIYSR
jgi:hypothetical protein